ncbi:protein-glutamine gamma-glutamyltransferase [Bacillus timonensis]|nr:protein-glutamine gamma-glutamyltransferase [Bacillus timonensis]
MIKIEHEEFDMGVVKELLGEAELFKIVENMLSYTDMYEYATLDELLFEVRLRALIARAAKDLNESGARFTTFATSFPNKDYWNLTPQGAFVLREDVSPSQGLKDIFIHGDKYQFECATAMVIVFYKAILDHLSEGIFNRFFKELVLYDWHYDSDLGLITTVGNDFLTGDCLYFKNPEFNPQTPQWRGENVIVVDENLYFGHGIGIKTAEEMIESLNKKRKEDATESAYLLEQVSRPDFKHLYSLYIPIKAENLSEEFKRNKTSHISISIGTNKRNY